MRPVIRLFLLLLFAYLPVAAQEAPRVEVFGGYSYLRFNPGTPSGVDLEGVNLNGWNAAISGNLNDWFGVVADFSGHYGSPRILNVPVDTKIHSFLFGPRVSYRKKEKVAPFVHALFGVTRLDGSASGLTDKQNAFTVALGGGVDVKASDSVAIRVFQADYVLTRFKEASIVCIANPLLPPCPLPETNSQHNARLSFGVVFRFGK